MGDFSRIYKADLTDRQLMAFWDMVRNAGRDRSVGYDEPAVNPAGFAQWMRHPDVKAWLVLFRGAPQGLFYLSGMQGKSAQAHFCTLPMGTERIDTPMGRLSALVCMGLYAIGQALWQRNVSGGSVLDTLIGITPACNARAVRYVRALGGAEFCTLPGACFFHDTGENVPGVVTVFTRETTPEWAASL